MKKRNTVVLLTALALSLSLGITACGHADEADTSQKQPESTESQPSATATEEAASDIPQKQPESTESQPPVSEEAAADAETLVGNIETLGSGSFVINKTFVEILDDGSMLASSSLENKTLITVTYTDSTVFILRTVKNSGINPSDISDDDASRDQLKAGDSVSLTGATTGEGFSASEVVITHYL